MKKHVTIIAEAGVNHNGSIDTAKKLIDAAEMAGADFVKFQTFKANKLTTINAKQANYQKRNLNSTSDTQFEMLKKLELNESDHFELFNYCSKKNIKFLSSGFDIASVDFLHNMNIEYFKIPSGEITNKPYLQHIARKKKSVIISTGMADMSEIEAALLVMMDEGLQRELITVLHCNTEYPTPMNDVNLKAMLTIRDAFNVKVGYSDHTLGIEVPIAAVAMGAEVIEKHFTLSRNLPGPDHLASLEPDELKAMVLAIRNIEKAISGDGTKHPSPSELPNRMIARKSIHILFDIPAGTKLTDDHLVMKRPGDGISPMMITKIVGHTIKKGLPADYKLNWNDLI